MTNRLIDWEASEQAGLDRLTPRRREVLLFACKGLRNSEISQLLRLSERTVKGYVSQLFLIFDVSNRTELVGKVLGENMEAVIKESIKTD
jgi:DNA-binding NarL/FixJ family response regulator